MRNARDIATEYNDAGAALHKKHELDGAIEAFRAALRIDPELGVAADNLGVVLRERGDLAEAKRWFLRAIELEPQNGRFLRHLVDHEPIEADNPLVTHAERVASVAHKLPPDLRIEALFGYARVLENLGRLDEAFAVLKRANRLRRKTFDYDEVAMLRSFDLLVDTFGCAFIDAMRDCGHPSARPIFIIGMPRSGTTLVEALLAAHPNVRAGGELVSLENCIAAMPKIKPGSSLADLRALMNSLGAAYIADTDAIAHDVPHLTDKLPFNYRFVPLIHAALPNARIIHMRRDPLDVAYSCFATHFVDDVPFSYDLAELGCYYRAYERLMATWKNVVPSGRILDVEYEEIVADIETQARRILRYCGLDWDDAVLRFHESRHPVRSASQTQVRRPLYATSVGRGAALRRQLGPFERARAGLD